MKVNYHPETDSLYIDVSEQPSVARSLKGLCSTTTSQETWSV
jgi:uncharacterized protein YuzE